MVCHVSSKSVSDFHRKLGGANEAVIRMLISIGRLVDKSSTVNLLMKLQPGERACLYRSGKETREDLVWIRSQVSSRNSIFSSRSYTAFRVYKTVRSRYF